MGKRIELTEIYRPKPKGAKCASVTSSTKPPPAPAKSNTRQATVPRAKRNGPDTASPTAADIATAGTLETNLPPSNDASAILAHKRAVKAAQMRRFRARQKAAKVTP